MLEPISIAIPFVIWLKLLCLFCYSTCCVTEPCRCASSATSHSQTKLSTIMSAYTCGSHSLRASIVTRTSARRWPCQGTAATPRYPPITTTLLSTWIQTRTLSVYRISAVWLIYESSIILMLQNSYSCYYFIMFVIICDIFS